MGIEEKLQAAQAALRAVVVECDRERAERASRCTPATPAPQYPMTWVKLDRYLEMSGDTMDAVQARRKVGKWLDGRECKTVDGRVWVNLKAVDEWIERWGEVGRIVNWRQGKIPPT